MGYPHFKHPYMLQMWMILKWKVKKLKEKNFENQVKDFLKEENCWHVKYWGGGEFTKAGVPDILACVDGYFFGIEVKAPKGTPSDLQIVNLKKIDDAGGFAILLYPNDFDAFKELVDAVKKGHIEVMMDIYDELKGRWWKKWEQVSK